MALQNYKKALAAFTIGAGIFMAAAPANAQRVGGGGTGDPATGCSSGSCPTTPTTPNNNWNNNHNNNNNWNNNQNNNTNRNNNRNTNTNNNQNTNTNTNTNTNNNNNQNTNQNTANGGSASNSLRQTLNFLSLSPNAAAAQVGGPNGCSVVTGVNLGVGFNGFGGTVSFSGASKEFFLMCNSQQQLYAVLEKEPCIGISAMANGAPDQGMPANPALQAAMTSAYGQRRMEAVCRVDGARINYTPINPRSAAPAPRRG